MYIRIGQWKLTVDITLERQVLKSTVVALMDRVERRALQLGGLGLLNRIRAYREINSSSLVDAKLWVEDHFWSDQNGVKGNGSRKF